MCIESVFIQKNTHNEVFWLILAFLTFFGQCSPLDDFSAIFVASRLVPVLANTTNMSIHCVEVTKMLVWQVTGPHSDILALGYGLH